MKQALIKKKPIPPHFEKAAKSYDDYALIQEKVFHTLVNKVQKSLKHKKNQTLNICDIGCGTGKNTQKLAKIFPQSHITAIDISPAMIDFAKQNNKNPDLEFIVGNAETLTLNRSFDLIISNASFQWFQDLNRTLYLLKSFLKKEGTLAFSIFGPKTFHELKHALSLFIGKQIMLPSSTFLDGNTLHHMINTTFSTPNLDQEKISTTYPSIHDLFKSIKFTGTKTHPLSEKKFWTPSCLKKLEKVYRSEYRNIIATYQVFYSLSQIGTPHHA